MYFSFLITIHCVKSVECLKFIGEILQQKIKCKRLFQKYQYAHRDTLDECAGVFNNLSISINNMQDFWQVLGRYWVCYHLPLQIQLDQLAKLFMLWTVFCFRN